LQDICTQEGVSTTTEALHLIARKSEGCMRDALSILDKITSFTGGSLTYENTLEHLNVLDEDSFFKILDAMNTQDLPAMMTLYDSINAKGFEADVFLNGFAEFLRNLLFAYHADTMALVDVADAFRKKYLAASASMPIQVVLNALTIIGNAENELKTAKNKKLFVEMTLIKLCYMQQAMQVVATNNNVVARKNIAGPIAYKQVTTWRNKPAATAASLTIEPTKRSEVKPNDTTAIQTTHVTVPEILATTGIKSLGKAGLAQMKDAFRKNNKDADNFKEVTLEHVQEVWNEIAEALRNQQKLNSSKVLQLATLNYDAQRNHVTILTTSQIQFSSISQETLMINERLKDVFGSNKPIWELVIQEPDEITTPNNGAQEKVLSSIEQYKKMIELYPDIKLFREMFRLDLER
jgi:DNA polymerase III subunit gamma/tau